MEFIWSPLLDTVRLPFLGLRRSLDADHPIALLLLLASYAFVRPQEHLSIILGLACATAFFSASQDIVIDAFRREVLSDEELVLGNSLYVNVYRISSLIPASLSLILADRLPWSTVFIITSLFMIPGLLATLFIAREPDHSTLETKGLKETVIEPFTISLPDKV